MAHASRARRHEIRAAPDQRSDSVGGAGGGGSPLASADQASLLAPPLQLGAAKPLQTNSPQASEGAQRPKRAEDDYAPTAFLNSSSLLVCSQVKFGSERPK